MKKGDRVGAIQKADENTVWFFGYGLYVGNTIPIKEIGFPIPNPTIELDNGKIVYGLECWWGSEEEVKKAIGERKIIEVYPDRREDAKPKR